MTTGLTETELYAMDLTASLANALASIVGNGPTQADDLHELVGHIHVIQHAIMSQAAGRAHPDHFRLLGETL